MPSMTAERKMAMIVAAALLGILTQARVQVEHLPYQYFHALDLNWQKIQLTIHVRESLFDSTAHGNNTISTKHTPIIRQSTIYPYLLSVVAQEFMQRMVLNDRIKNSIEYKNVFDGQQAVDKLMIILGTRSRWTALKVGRALGDQGCFHDVLYENVLLDSSTDIYQFKDLLFYNQPNYRQQHGTSTSTTMTSTLTPASATTTLITTNSSYNSNSDNQSSTTWAGTITTGSTISDYSTTTDDRNTLATATITTLEDEDVNNDDDDDDIGLYSTAAITKKENATPTFFVNGVFTPLTRCYASSCDSIHPCYSPSCRERQQKTFTVSNLSSSTTTGSRGTEISFDSRSTPHTYLRQREQMSWAEMVSDDVLNSVSTLERKRQEAICELIYTEVNFVMDLDYLGKMWIEPLLSESIIPLTRRQLFVDKVFSNITNIHQAHAKLAKKLRKRQNDHPIVVEIGDILLKYVDSFAMIIDYGANQHEAKFIYEKERYLNPKFDAFAEYTERHPSSHKLELNGYLTKPTTRLGRYPLLLGAILKRTSPEHPDYDTLSKVMTTVREFLSKVNVEAGNAKNRFDLENIHHHLSFRRKSDRLDLKLLEPGRRIEREGFLNKRPNLDAADYQVILFDHYLVVAKVKWVRAEKHYLVVRRPLAIPFLAVSIPTYLPSPQRTSSILMSSRHSQQRRGLISTENDNAVLPMGTQGHPLLFQHLGRKKHGDSQYVLFASSQASRKPWIDQIHQLQAYNHSPNAVMTIHTAVQPGQFKHKSINQVVPFQNNQLLVFAMDDGVYAGKNDSDGVVHKVLHLDHVTHIHVIEEFQMLLVLADKILWQYNLTDVMNGKLGVGYKNQPIGRKIQSNVPFFYVGTCLQRTLVCVPKVSPLKSVITMLEPCKPQAMTDKKPTLLKRLVPTTVAGASSSYIISSTDIYLKKFKECYIPCEAWAVELSNTKLWITGHRGIMIVDMQRTDRTQPMLDPYDPQLTFITDREKHESRLKIRLPVKHISVFRTPLNDYLICYDEYAFYVNAKGNRTRSNFLIEWEGCAESYALIWPYVVAFETSFIEIRHAITGQLDQVIRGERIRCLQHRIGDVVYGVMADPDQTDGEYVFKLVLLNPPSITTTCPI
ncbi:uncharacterized protein BX664DRAFT_321781 [Halteromyces radiatus]|uniref:uncharacterized protein n=1 Tax=Halteromyces radiatus TaxID=101107 RepID=UPI00221FE8B3|nr:uncharacterized protein BX664DRAFT_321781 [Halteromyces radiatus]KAI8099635.1 hypothetical protein BX664DRAFT_321781 [Halteromyces radiatus]